MVLILHGLHAHRDNAMQNHSGLQLLAVLVPGRESCSTWHLSQVPALYVHVPDVSAALAGLFQLSMHVLAGSSSLLKCAEQM